MIEEMRRCCRAWGEDVDVRVALHAEDGTIHADLHQSGAGSDELPYQKPSIYRAPAAEDQPWWYPFGAGAA